MAVLSFFSIKMAFFNFLYMCADIQINHSISCMYKCTIGNYIDICQQQVIAVLLHALARMRNAKIMVVMESVYVKPGIIKLRGQSNARKTANLVSA